MNKKLHSHKCNMKDIGGAKTGDNRIKPKFQEKKVSKKIVRSLYDKYYKNQIAELYRAVSQ